MSFEKNFTEAIANLYRSFITPVAEFVIEKYKIDVSLNTLVNEIKEAINLPELSPSKTSVSAGINSFAPSLNMTSPLPAAVKNTAAASTPSKKTRGTTVNKPVQIWLPLEEFKEQQSKDAKICAYMSNRIKDEEKRGKVCAAVVEDTSDSNPLKWRCVNCKGKASDIEKEFEKENKTSKKSSSITGVIPPIPDTKSFTLPSGTMMPPGINFNMNVPPLPSIEIKPSTPKALVSAPKLPSPKKETPKEIPSEVSKEPLVPELPSIPELPAIPKLPEVPVPEPVKEPEVPEPVVSVPEPVVVPEPVQEPEVPKPEVPALPPAPKPATPKPASPVSLTPKPFEGFSSGHLLLEIKGKQYLFGMSNGKYYIHGKFENLTSPAPSNYTSLLVEMNDTELSQFAGVLTYEYLGPKTNIPSFPGLPVINLPGIPSIPGL